MPTPRTDENRDQFISRCISYLFNREGVTDKQHAYAKCTGIWNQHKERK